MDISVSARRALVCGASKGIGRAIAIELALNGASVVALARGEAGLKSVMAELDTQQGQRHQYIVADVAQGDNLIHSVNNNVEEYGVIHILVNNTAGPASGALVDSDVESLQQAFENHVVIGHRLTQLLSPGMMQANYGRVINIISTSVKQPIDGLGVSNTIRGAMASWSKTMATELGRYSITVNNVLPGATDTERLSAIVERNSAVRGLSQDQVRLAMSAEIPLGRFAQASEIANAVAFLASPAAAYINGTSILVDGGRTRTLS